MRTRFGEILAILSRHHIVKELTPEKLRAIFEDLGPTYVKLGQIISTRSDILSEAYCVELAKLRSDAAPMPIETVREAIKAEYGKPCDDVFTQIDPAPLGSASIAQAHLAVLPDGRRVVAKVQRPNIYEMMARDIALLKKASRLIKLTPVGGAFDFSLVLDELWKAAQHEMNFLEEAQNLREFSEKNREIRYVACPAVIDELVTPRILVLEYVDGLQIDDSEALSSAGYDPAEIAAKLAENFIKQVVDDRFFHADPHPGNIRVRDGRIVWIDLGMMGRLSETDGSLFTRYVAAIAANDVEAVTDVVLGMGVYSQLPDRTRLSSDIEVLLARYRQMSLSSINVGRVMEEFLALARKHGISMPASLTMLARSVVIIESVLTKLDPNTNLLKIMSAHLRKDFFDSESMRERLQILARQFVESSEKLTAIPGQVSDTLNKILAGHTTVNVNIAGQEQESRAKDARCRRLALAIVTAALILSAGIASLSSLPGPAGLPWLSAAFLAAAVFALTALFFPNRR